MADKDVEGGKQPNSSHCTIPHYRQVLDQGGVTPDVENWDYDGSGTEEDPYVVVWIDNDPRNPMHYSPAKKWSLTMLVAMSTLAVAFVSSAYSGSAEQVIREFGCSQEVFVLGISLFVLGFAIGPLLWAPFSELFGRQVLFFGTSLGLTAFNAGAAGSQNIWTLIILRFFSGAIGSSPLTNAGGVIADMFPAKQRGLAMSLFAAAPFMGPVLGPIAGGFIGETVGWRWNEGVMSIFTGVLWVLTTLFLPETYPPVILRKRAEKLSQMTGKVYKTQGEIRQGATNVAELFKTSLSRPWILLFKEPIVFLLSIYMAIIYGTLYMCFSAFPIVFQEKRGWSAGIGGLAFLGVAVGMLLAVAYSVYANKRYSKISDEYDGFAPPEARLPLCMVGSVAVPISLIWFAWTNYPSIQFMVPIIALAPFGFGMVLIFLGIMNYLIDSYTIFAASVLAANSVLRSVFGAVFPLFTTQMYDGLGIHWATMIPGFLALICVPFPFLFYKYGPAIRAKCKYAAESEAFMRQMQNQMKGSGSDDDDDEDNDSEFATPMDAAEAADEEKPHHKHHGEHPTEPVEEVERQPSLTESEKAEDGYRRFAPIHATRSKQTARSQRSQRSQNHYYYDESPFDLDRVNTMDSFKSNTIANQSKELRSGLRGGSRRESRASSRSRT
ncbi:MFS general substrate transporter [Lecanosticta acicola]|uniref:MFS general substrate transporter n=1 Tax=Lecanosticta acicola TaxID=111012 RepID=A0AAI9E9K8_9PEZI|nr:MFS general substrate transporter [Lecanosticta acicola]